MAKTRLSQEKRNMIRYFAKDLLTRLIREELKMDAADARMREHVLKRIGEEYPANEMAILQKYETADQIENVKVIFDHQRDMIDWVNLKGHCVNLPLVPNRLGWNWSLNVHGKAASTWFEKQRALKTAFEQRVDDYNRLVQTANTFEDVLEVFPAVEALREKITGKTFALTSLNDDVKLRIWNDQNKMIKAIETDKQNAAAKAK